MQYFLTLVAIVTLNCVVTKTSQAKEVKLTIDQTEWAPEQIQIMNRAAIIVINRLPSTRVAKCAFRNATRGKPAKRDWEKKMAAMRRGKTLELRIQKKPLSDKTLGRAKIGVAKTKKFDAGYSNLDIILNSNHVDYEYRDKHMKKSDNQYQQRYNVEEFWAKTIAHEIAHNLGLKHGSSKVWADSYAGYFITELGACVKNDGLYGTINPQDRFKMKAKK